MFRATRIAVAAILTMAIAALPVVLDRCAESCEAHQGTVSSAPACHHATSTGTRISQVPTSCGHDHNGTAVVAAKSPAPTGRSFDSIVAVESELSVAPAAAVDFRVRPHSPPRTSTTLDRRSLPLRI